MSPELVLVTWHDAHADAEEHEPSQIAALHKPTVVSTCGYLVRRDKTGITIARDIDENGHYDGRLFVPAGIIKRVQRVT